MARYVDPDAGGSGTGADWTNAYTTLQAAIDDTTNVTAGTTVYCRLSSSASELISVAIDFDGNSGTLAAGNIEFIGCNSSGVVDGTQYVVDCGTNVISGFLMKSGFITLENIELKSSMASGSNDGIYNGSPSYYGWQFKNVWVHGFRGDGFDTYYTQQALFIRCKSTNNGASGTGGGFRGYYSHTYIACQSYDNTGYGFYSANQMSTYIGCIVRDNTTYGIRTPYLSHIINCVINNNGTHGVQSDATLAGRLVGCRITNNGGYGVNVASTTTPVQAVGCYFDNNSSGATNGNFVDVELNETSTNEMAGTDTDEGYADKAGDDYSLASDATLRSQLIELP